MNVHAYIPAPGLLDTDEAIDNLGGDVELYQQVVKLFLDDAYVQLAALKSALAANDFPAGRRFAHSLKGTSASVGAKRLLAVALRLENACAVADLACAELAMPVLEAEIEAAKAAFEAYFAG